MEKPQQLDLLIIRPTDRDKVYMQLDKSVSAIEPPLWVALIAAYVREKKYSVKIIDVEAEDLGPEQAASKAKRYNSLLTVFAVTGSNLSASTWHMTGTRYYISEFKKKMPVVKTLLWGLHPSALPEKTLEEEGADFVCQGEGFVTLVELLGVLKSNNNAKRYEIPGLWYYENGQIRSNDRPEPIKELDTLPDCAWDLLPMKKYRAHNWQCLGNLGNRSSYGVVYTSLGCPFDCSFCNLKALFGSPGIRFRSAQRVVDEIGTLVKKYDVKNLKVLDECFVLKPSHVHEICDLLIARDYDLNIWAYARVDTVNEKLLKKLKQAGFHWLCYGIESADTNVRADVSKGNFNKDDIKKAISITKDAGISIIANFMFGLPEDNFETMQKTLDLAKELNCEFTNFYSTKAYPGSQLYDMAIRDNVRLPEVWRGYAELSEESLPLPTKYISGRDVLLFRDKAFIEFHSNPKYMEMINKKFGKVAVDHLKDVLSHKLVRKHA